MYKDQVHLITWVKHVLKRFHYFAVNRCSGEQTTDVRLCAPFVM